MARYSHAAYFRVKSVKLLQVRFEVKPYFSIEGADVSFVDPNMVIVRSYEVATLKCRQAKQFLPVSAPLEVVLKAWATVIMRYGNPQEDKNYYNKNGLDFSRPRNK